MARSEGGRDAGGAVCVRNGTVVLPDATVPNGVVLVKGGRIVHAGKARPAPRGAEVIDAKGGLICPGLIDVHIHGAGKNSLDPPTPETFRAVADALLAHGVTQHVPTMMPSEEVAEGLAALIDETGLQERVPGIYVEGPFVNVKRRGGIQERFVFPVDLKRLDRIARRTAGRTIMMTFAPELEGAEVLPAALRDHGMLPCVGHTEASSERIAEVIGRRKINFTHLFNAMSGVDHRRPGAALHALTNDRA